MIYYASDKLESDYLEVDSRLRIIMPFIASKILADRNMNVIITSAIRTAEQDRALKASGVHVAKRALDFNMWDPVARKKHYNPEYAGELCDFVNSQIIYGSHKTMIYHDVGYGQHFHLQVNPSNTMTLKRI